jgi:amino acid transporter
MVGLATMTEAATSSTSSLAPGELLDETERRLLVQAGRSWATDPARSAVAASLEVDLDVEERRGARPGDRYVRVSRLHREGLEKVSPGVLQATRRASEPTSGLGRLTTGLREVVLGRPLASWQLSHERLSKKKALAILSSDPLSSVAYGPEAILVVLVAAGGVGYGALVPVAVVIVALLGALLLSYRQIIRMYPNAGGSYVVAKENLGPVYGLVAGASLVTDYVLTVSVSVAGGMAAITSAYPAMKPYTVEACLGVIALVMIANLRGIRESASLFMLPTYIFVAAMFATIATILVKLAVGSPHPVSPPSVPATEGMGILLVLKAFSSGCASLTGVEAMSNSVGAFKPVEWRNARTALTTMGILDAGMLLGVAVCARLLNLGVSSDQTVLSQLGHYAFGGGVMYQVLQYSTFLVLVLAANTSFTGFPRLFYFMARDGYAPRMFTRMGDRLAYSNGIIVLGLLAALLVWAFHGETNSLLPLYTIGVFVAFTLAQAGMVARWRRRREPGWRRGLAINSAGMVMTGVVFVITAEEKFRTGAWIVLLVVPLLVLAFRAIRGHYAELEGQAATETPTSPSTLRPVCIVPVADLNPIALQSLAFARTIGDNVIAVHVVDEGEDNALHIARLRAKWDAWGNHVPLEIIESPYRSLVQPLLRFINVVDRRTRDATIVVVLPEMVATRWWHHLLHNQTALRLKATLLFRPGTVVVSVPYHLRRNRRLLRLHRIDVDTL